MDPLNPCRAAWIAWPLVLGLAACSSATTSGERAGGGMEMSPASPGSGAVVDAAGASGVVNEAASGPTAAANEAGSRPTGLANEAASGPSATANQAASGAVATSTEIPIVAGMGADVPYQLGINPYGIQGAAFFARSAMGTTTVVLDKTQSDKICLSGTVEAVPTPADGSHPPYSTYWGIDLGFNLNQAPDSDPNAKPPWSVAPGVVGFSFTVEGATIPPIRFKTTPTGRDPAQEQDSCALVAPVSGVPNQILFTDMYVQCWDGPQGTGTTDTSKGLLDVGLQVAAGTDAAIPLDFCLTGFGVISK